MTTPEKTLNLIAALLAKAERTDNVHERDTFMSAAQKLATRNSINLAKARGHAAKASKREQVEERTIILGTAGQRSLPQYVRLLLAIAAANDVECFIARNSTRVFAVGFPSDLALIEALYASLLVQMVAACERYLVSPQRRDAVFATWSDASQEWVYRPVHGAVARRTFYDGFAAEVRERLDRAREQVVAESQAGEAARGETGRALVTTAVALRDKGIAVGEYARAYAGRAGVRGTWSGARRQGRLRTSGASQAAGRRAGQQARLDDEAPARGIGS